MRRRRTARDFTAGVLDGAPRAGFNPFDLMLGTSPAQNAACGNQQGYARKVITIHRHASFDLDALCARRQPIDLDWLVEPLRSKCRLP